jgi:hypothetical protein
MVQSSLQPLLTGYNMQQKIFLYQPGVKSGQLS